MVGGVIVKLDKQHVTRDFAMSLAPEVDMYLKSLGILRP
jgi:hypothetical protein